MTITIQKRISLLICLFALILQSCGHGGGGGGGSSVTPPTMTAVSPGTGTVGTTVTITGTNFKQSGAGADPTVTFTPAAGGTGVGATVKTFSATSMDATVPAVTATDATKYNITVTNSDGGAATLANAFTMAAPTVTDINGGLSGSGTVGSLFIIDGNNFGDLSAAPASGYSVDFRDSGTSAVVATASVDFVAGNWANIFIEGTVPNTLTASTTYKVTVTTPSGTSAASNFLILGSVSFSPSTILWTATSSLPAAQQGFPSVIVPIGTSSYIYALGGNTSTGTAADKTLNVDTVDFNVMDNATGALVNASWASTTSLPDKRGFAAAVSANSFNSLVSGNGNLYVLGGLDGTGVATSTVYYASLNSDGTIPASGTGAWTTTTALPQALFAESAVIFHGRIYVAGGNDSTGAPVATVYSAKLNSDGTLGNWDTGLPALPEARAYHQLVTFAGYLYVLGGDNAAADPITKMAGASQSTIYYNQVNIRNGALVNTPWTTNGSGLIKNVEKHTAVVAGSYILVSGGLYGGDTSGSTEESYASINTDGSVASFGGATGSHTISGSAGGYNFFNHSATYFVDVSGNPHVLILGGEDTNDGSLHLGVWYQH
ncbi:MAG: IPT/TIG domain-containing protein [Nitrospirae bacterium]|nr:IPT/TIG domain-containing protein [Nitrospirota bacterium]